MVVSAITQKKEDELKETIAKFEELLSTGISKAEAAKRLGYSDYASVWKKYEELKRIQTENRSRQTFKDSLKVNNIVPITENARTEERQKENLKIQDVNTEVEK